MKKGVFPTQLMKGIKEQPALLNLQHISHFMELSQLAPDLSNPLWVHTDPVSMKQPDVAEEVNLFRTYFNIFLVAVCTIITGLKWG